MAFVVVIGHVMYVLFLYVPMLSTTRALLHNHTLCLPVLALRLASGASGAVEPWNFSILEDVLI